MGSAVTAKRDGRRAHHIRTEMNMQFTHKFHYPVPVAGLSADWQIAEIEGEVDCSVEHGAFDLNEVRVYAMGPRIGGKSQERMHPIDATSALHAAIVNWLIEKKADDLRYSYEDALDLMPSDHRKSYAYEHALTASQVL
jgi:hypothetical protein